MRVFLIEWASMNIPVDIFRLSPDVPIPEYKTPGAVAFDLAVIESKPIEPGQTVFFETGLVIRVPEGHALILASRSSNAKKQISLANGIGIIDQDYCGPNDQLHLAIRNFGEKTYLVEKGERIAQGLIVPIARAEFRILEQLETSDRGGFGTTG